MSGKTPIALEDRNEDNGRLFSPSAGRNLEPIMDAFTEFGLTSGRVLELGSGTGQHAAHLVDAHDGLVWVASDRDEASLQSCQAWSDHFGHGDRMTVRSIDLLAGGLLEDVDALDVIYSSNVIHIAPIDVLNAMLELSKDKLREGGRFVFYGPFSREGQHNSDGNRNFDVSLKTRDPSWGVRDLEHDVVPRAKIVGLKLRHVRDMPANNYMVVFEKVGAPT